VAKKLYVGNLAYAVTEQDLKDLFSQSGTVESVAVISDKFTSQSKGFGFVEMADTAAADAAIKALDGSELKGRNIRVNEAKPREGGGGGGPARGRRRGWTEWRSQRGWWSWRPLVVQSAKNRNEP
jgi:RNA recognition motif-containing protein